MTAYTRTVQLDQPLAVGDSLVITVKAPAVQATPPPPPPPPTNGQFTGDPTGSTDVTAALTAYLAAGGARSFAPGAIYKVSRIDLVGKVLSLAYNGARLTSPVPLAVDEGILTLKGCTATIDDAWVIGPGYTWVDAQQGQHGISVIGGNVTLNRPKCQNTRGDGIYQGYGWGQQPGVLVVNDPVMEHNARNGIANVAGKITINRGSVRWSGLHGIDAEPNTLIGATSTDVLIDGTDIRDYSDIKAVGFGYAIGGGWGFTTARKKRLAVRNVTGAKLEMAVSAFDVLEFTGCKSETPATIEYWNSGVPVVSGNVNVTMKGT